MEIIIDTREQKPLRFTGHKTTHRKLDEGDYNIQELIPHIVIERKTMSDLYGSIIQNHKRFKSEIVRSRLQGKTFYVFLEGSLKGFYNLIWTRKQIGTHPETLNKIINTIIERYQIIFIECPLRRKMAELMIQTLETNKKLYGV
jgi:ERCC4-type nuclease